MNSQEQRALHLLSEIERDGCVTQRFLAKRLGVAVGLTNLYLKRLARKGYIKVTSLPRNRIKYLLTPRGIAAKARLTYQYLSYSLHYYKEMRKHLAEVLKSLSESGTETIMICGTGELAELAYLSLSETDLELLGFVGGDVESRFLSLPVWPVSAVPRLKYDAILIADMQEGGGVVSELVRIGVPPRKIVAAVSPK